MIGRFKEIYVIDHETYWDDQYTLSKMTTHEYVRDARFECQGVAVIAVNADSRMWLEADEFATMVKYTDWANSAVVHHHAHFDGFLGAEHFGLNRIVFGPDGFNITNRVGLFLDTLPMARYLVGPVVGASLAKVAEYFGRGTKGDYSFTVKGQRRAQMSKASWMKLGEYALNDAELTLRILVEDLLPHFGDDELDLMDRVTRMFVEPSLLVDETLLAPYLEWERRRREEIVAELGVPEAVFQSSDKFAALLESLGVDAPMKRNPKGELIYAFAKSDPGMQELLEDADEVVRSLAETRVMMKSTQSKSRAARVLDAGAGGLAVPIYLSMYAAHTTRLGGADAMNWQNLEKVKWEDVPGGGQRPKPNTGVIRRSLKAPPGYVAVVADASQIEARFNAWNTGESWMCEAFAGGRDIYSEVATMLYGRPVNRKKNAADYIPGFVGKTCTLGLGYGMAWLRLAYEMLKGALGGPPVQFDLAFVDQLGVDLDKYLTDSFLVEVSEMTSRVPFEDRAIHCAVAAAIVERYRRRIQNITGAWKFYNDTVLPAIAAGATIEYGPGGIFRTEKDAVVGPNGMRLFYRQLHTRETKTKKGRTRLEWWFLSKRGKHEKVYGGKHCENITQFATRIITMQHGCVLAREHPHWQWATTTHDELVFAVPRSEAEYAVKRSIEVMSTPLDWCRGLPLAAEADYADTYGDAK